MLVLLTPMEPRTFPQPVPVHCISPRTRHPPRLEDLLTCPVLFLRTLFLSTVNRKICFAMLFKRFVNDTHLLFVIFA